MSLSHWEYDYYCQANNIVIIGCGITGMSTALSIKAMDPTAEVVIVDHSFPPQGASTKNAGFVCFGSPSEILDDLQHMTESECIDIIQMRWQGAAILKERLAKYDYKPEPVGGYELFQDTKVIDSMPIEKLNQLMYQGTGVLNYFSLQKQVHFPFFHESYIMMKEEAQINAMTMISILFQDVTKCGIKCYFGANVEEIDTNDKIIHLSNEVKIPYNKLAITTNGFTKNLFPETEVVAARNQVLMTSEIPNLKWNGVYHFDKGYYYFRRYGNRILLGGARNKDAHNELTQDFGNTAFIQEELIHFLENHILGHQNYNIDQWWSGILGIGESKYPIVQEVQKDVYLGVRLGGMGVAIGSLLGQKLSELIMT